jgi:hypothetical protein
MMIILKQISFLMMEVGATLDRITAKCSKIIKNKGKIELTDSLKHLATQKQMRGHVQLATSLKLDLILDKPADRPLMAPNHDSLLIMPLLSTRKS